MQKNTAMFEIIVWYFNFIKKDDTVVTLILRRINYKHSGDIVTFMVCLDAHPIHLISI